MMDDLKAREIEALGSLAAKLWDLDVPENEIMAVHFAIGYLSAEARKVAKA